MGMTKQLKSTAGPVSLFPEEQSLISFAVTEILSLKHTDGRIDIILLCMIDIDEKEEIEKAKEDPLKPFEEPLNPQEDPVSKKVTPTKNYKKEFIT